MNNTLLNGLKRAFSIGLVALTVVPILAGQEKSVPTPQKPDAAHSAGNRLGNVDYTRNVAAPMATVLERVRNAVEEQGFRVTGTHDLAASLKAAGIEREPYTVLEVCKPQIASTVLDANPRLGSLMPCRLAVYRQGDKTFVTTILPSHLVTLLPMQSSEQKESVQSAAKTVDAFMRTIIDSATTTP